MKEDPLVYGAEFVLVFLAKARRTASIQEGLECLGFHYLSLEGEHYFGIVVELM